MKAFKELVFWHLIYTLVLTGMWASQANAQTVQSMKKGSDGDLKVSTKGGDSVTVPVIGVSGTLEGGGLIEYNDDYQDLSAVCTSGCSNLTQPTYVAYTRISRQVWLHFYFPATLNPTPGTFARVTFSGVPFMEGKSFPSSVFTRGGCSGASDGSNQTAITTINASGGGFQVLATDDNGPSATFGWKCYIQYLIPE